ncbi:MAG: peptidoglycan DD-metalloendopeptidase family protein [Butyrivibrio sp.]|nr:peptidoglycan DD-metalloendopeptidase family protein [Butyrivibrio sp.]
MGMKRNKNGVSKERIIMLASAVLVLTALTATGIFVRSNRQTEEESNVLDFSVIETDENALPNEVDEALFAEIGTDDLDYDPGFQEANSDSVENVDNTPVESENPPEETDGQTTQSAAKSGQKKDKDNSKTSTGDEEGMFDENKEGEAKASKPSESESDTKQTDAPSDSSATDVSESVVSDETAEEAIATTVQPLLDFNEEDGLMWPIVGNILINYSMDKTIYFATLQQYKYNPGIVIAATEGEAITAAADGRVVSVDYDSQLGNTVVMDLGNQYELTYGQLDDITVSEGSYVAAGDIIGNVAHPTKYYSSEGANVFFKLTKDGEPVNPMSRLSQ